MKRRFRRQPFILLSFSSSKKARKALKTQSYQRFQCIGHTGFKGLSNAVTNTHPLLPSMGTTRQKSSCRNRLQNGPHSLLRMKVGTHSPLPTGLHTAAYTPKQGLFRMGALLRPSERSARSPTSPGRVSERQTLPLLGLGRGCSRRTQRACGAAMRLCASLLRRRRGPAGLRNLFRFCRNCGFHALCSGPFRVCEVRGGITTLDTLCVLPKRWMAACQNDLFAVF